MPRLDYIVTVDRTGIKATDAEKTWEVKLNPPDNPVPDPACVMVMHGAIKQPCSKAAAASTALSVARQLLEVYWLLSNHKLKP